MVNLGPMALFSNYKLITSNGKHSKDIGHAYIVSSMYKLKTTAEDSYILTIGFDRYRGRRQRELTKNKNIKGKYHVIFHLTDLFGFAEHQEKATFGHGCKLTLTRNSDSDVLIKDNAITKLKL